MRLLRWSRGLSVGVIVLGIAVLFGAIIDHSNSTSRIAWFRLAWAYEEQQLRYELAAQLEETAATREREEAQRWPEGSEQRDAHLEAAARRSYDRSRWLGVVEVCRRSAAYYRRIARDRR
jgi:hypothetical protein